MSDAMTVLNGKNHLPSVSAIVGPPAKPYASGPGLETPGIPATPSWAGTRVGGYYAMGGVTTAYYINSPGNDGPLRAYAFYGRNQGPTSIGDPYAPPTAWCQPGTLLRRPRTVFIAAGTPSAQYPYFVGIEAGSVFGYGNSGDYASQGVLYHPALSTTTADIPGTIPSDLYVFPYPNNTGGPPIELAGSPLDLTLYGPGGFWDGRRNDTPGDFISGHTPFPAGWLDNPIYTYVFPTNYANAGCPPLPHPGIQGQDGGWGTVVGARPDWSKDVTLPILTSDFLYIHVGTLFNAWSGFNVETVVNNLKWFPRYAVRLYTPSYDGIDANLSSLTESPGNTAGAVFIGQAAQAYIANWTQAANDACQALRAAGVDAQVVGDENDATPQAIGRLISDFYGLNGP